MTNRNESPLNAEQVNKSLPANQIFTLSDEHKPTEREIEAAVASELMAEAIRVSGVRSSLGVDVTYNACTHYIEVSAANYDEQLFCVTVFLGGGSSAGILRQLIKRVAALGEVSS